ncbi:C-X-C chemokine receptor type 2-like [Brachyhypopomus gauderio]|uniref:C-X-C chemokine receptor type 2-like n=1 Tax=Brachyhypopomus gauderio TaxID=698409 RepID=UPI0040430C75
MGERLGNHGRLEQERPNFPSPQAAWTHCVCVAALDGAMDGAMEGHSHVITHDDISDILSEYDEYNSSEYFITIHSYNPDHALACNQLSLPDLNGFLCGFYVLVFLLAVAGNLVVSWVVLGSSRQRLSPSELFLFHLALADLLLALTLPLSAVSVLRGWMFGDFVCKLVSMSLEVNFYTSVLFLVCISAERYVMVVHTVRDARGGRGGRSARSWVACAFVWGLGLVLSLPTAVYNLTYPSQARDGQMQCGEHYDTSSAHQWRFAMRMLSHLLGFLLPLVAMLGFYGVTIARLVHTRSLRKQRAMRVIVAVVVAFLLCWCPYHVTMMMDTLLRAELVDSSCRRRHQADLALQVTHSLGVLHCCVNPVLYAFVGEKFRANLRRLTRRLWERESVSRYSRSTSNTSQEGNNALM